MSGYNALIAFEQLSDGRTIYSAHDPDLRGCTAQGATADIARAALDDVRRMYLAHLQACGLPVPSPRESWYVWISYAPMTPRPSMSMTH